MYAPPLTYYTLLVSYILSAHSYSVVISANGNNSSSRRLTTTIAESSSTNSITRMLSTTTIANTILSSSSKQMGGETTTKKYDPIKKLNQIKNLASKPTPTTNPETIVSTYRLKDEDGGTCILMTVDALISFLYVSNLNINEESDVFVPDERKIRLSGDCSDGEKSSMLLIWKSFTLNFGFFKTPGGERWYVNSIKLSFNTNDTPMQHPNHPNTYVEATTTEGDLLFPTPVGRSFKCHREIKIGLIDPQYPDLKVVLMLRELTLEPFIFKNDDFGPEYMCAAAGSGSFRSESAPFIFGSLLSLASICTISIYAIYRYLKVNKVQYDAME